LAGNQLSSVIPLPWLRVRNLAINEGELLKEDEHGEMQSFKIEETE
jgi:hypothetical protein